MTKKVSSILSLAIITILISSCIMTDKSLGSDLLPSDQNLKVEVKESEILLQMQIPDSLPAYSTSGNIVVGSLYDPILGKTKISSAVNLVPLFDSIRFGDAEAISFYIDLISSDNNVVLDDDSEYIPQNISVRRLIVELDSTRLYNNSIKPENISDDIIMSNSPVYFGGESLRISLSLDFAEEILDATDKELDSIILFTERFKGLYLECDERLVAGGRINNFSSTSSIASLKYSFTSKDEDGTEEKKDTIITFSIGYGAALFNGEYGSKALETDLPMEIVYSEGLTGIKPFISAKDIKEFINGISTEEGVEPEKIIISKASLIFPFTDFIQDYELIDKFPEQIYPCIRIRLDSLNYVQYTPAPDIYNATGTTGNKNRSLGHYECDLTSHITYLKNTDAKDYTEEDDLWVLPIYTNTDSYGQISYLANNYLYYYQLFNGNKSTTSQPTIKITYVML